MQEIREPQNKHFTEETKNRSYFVDFSFACFSIYKLISVRGIWYHWEGSLKEIDYENSFQKIEAYRFLALNPWSDKTIVSFKIFQLFIRLI